MNDLAFISIPKSDLNALQAWVYCGVAEFYRHNLRPQTDTESRLLIRAQQLLNSDQQADWQPVNDDITRNWPPKHGNLARCIREYQLTPPEAFLLMLAGEAETNPAMSFALIELQGEDGQGMVTVHLAINVLNALFSQASFTALDLTGSALLVRHILAIEGDAPLSFQNLRIAAPLWSVLLDRQTIWPDVPALSVANRALLPEQARRLLPRLADLLQKQVQTLILRGHPSSGRHLLATELAKLLGMTPLSTPLQLWQNNPAFLIACHYGNWLPVIQLTISAGEAVQLPEPAIAHPCIVILNMDGSLNGQQTLEFQIGLPDQQQRLQLWHQELQNHSLATQLSGSVLLSGPTIIQLARSALLYAQQEQLAVGPEHIRRARLDHGAEKLRLLAQPVLRQVNHDAVVFPPLVEEYLQDMIERAQRRESLWENLGDTMQANRNTGLRALFVGESGTGKTLAASYLANSLGAPLYRVDLGAVMNKYVGESEKNLGILLDQAATCDAILLFDEADSLFGSRTDAKQSGERFANNLTNYLLSRIENHPGIVILTTNNRERIDTAFNRRIEVIVDFPLPSFNERLRLWQSHLGKRAPDIEVLRSLASHCDLSGGQIRNAVLTAAGTQATDQIIEPRRLVVAVQREYQKLSRSLPSALENLGK